MSNMSWVTSWEKWREAMGPRGSRQRARVMDYLKSHPAILYWGDSWFSTPLYLNLARQSCLRINGMGMIVGKPGAEAAELFGKDDVKRMVARLKASPFDLLCLSAGGNDCLDDRLAQVFQRWQGRGVARISAAEAYQRLSDSGAFARVHAAFAGLLDALAPLRQERPALRVVGHPYVPIHRIGVAADLTVPNIGLIAWLKDDVGPWMWNRMQWVLADKAEGKRFADLILVEGFGRGVLQKLAGEYPGFFSVVDFAGVTGIDQDSFWNDEIHPTEQGFLQLSRPFNQHLRDQLPAAKRAAVG
ncbi:hypothetical protein [Stenotrophomonas sp. Marseille-Q4652]|uniref:hypothetical protein n=1 Tax=Stenotrophomonas sp. Marseille-Q4652 TaxID=2866595 RepID=UPI001CE49A64|nr:hypothetical protein [Stenotrophomonas sp. Marseille-Q4652]